ncbi:MAG: septum formation initiator family protein [Ruminococcus sp.]|nr:septum formation initiator family protein [Ruminococcus sp.]
MNDNKRSAAAAAAAKRKKDPALFKPLGWFAAFCLVIYSIIVIITQQVQIVRLKQEKQEISEQINEARQLNDEYTRLLASDDESAYMEKIAIEKLGYAYPNERRFYVVETN